MIKTYHISGMTCQGCVASVKKNLELVDAVKTVEVNLEKEAAKVTMDTPLVLAYLKSALPDKFDIDEIAIEVKPAEKKKTKFQQLKPLALIFVYLFSASFLLNYSDWDTREAMLDFMGLFYIVFSFFKFLDLKGFPESFKMYDPLTKALPFYAWVYPFIELVLGFLFLMRLYIHVALVVTIVILGITTVGVVQTLLNKKKIQCACLGTALQLPMTEATFIENTIMLVMAISMLAI